MYNFILIYKFCYLFKKLILIEKCHYTIQMTTDVLILLILIPDQLISDLFFVGLGWFQEDTR